MKISKKRWIIAQEYEKDFWLKNQKKTESEESIKNRTEWIKNEVSLYIKLNKQSRILQIGSGHNDIINFWKTGKKFAIDPLADFYKKNFPIKKDNVKFIEGVGEKLPYKKNYFDIIFLINVLDHCRDSEKVLEEVYRTLKKGGLIYIIVNTFGNISSKIRILLEIFQIDKGHPHTFTKRSIKNILKRKKIQIIKKDSPNKKRIFKEMRNSENLKLKILGYLNIAVIPYKIICVKK